MQQFKSSEGFDSDFKGYTIIIPSICVGNIAQLACDILIISKELKKVGQIFHSALIPLYGPAGYQHENKKSTACELYAHAQDKLLIIQLRSPLISKFAHKFHNYLADIVKDAKQVIILSSSYAFEKHMIEATSYEYQATEIFKELHKNQLENVGWKEYVGDKIFGSGNAMQLYKILAERNVPVILLFRYLIEGDNSADAIMILKELSIVCENLLQLHGQKKNLEITLPKSWKFLFGNDVTNELLF